jgi:hypothetical protein
VNERDLPTADRVIHLLRQLGIDRAHVVQGIAEVTGHPEVVASLALVTPCCWRCVSSRASLADLRGDYEPKSSRTPKCSLEAWEASAIDLERLTRGRSRGDIEISGSIPRGDSTSRVWEC